MLTLQQPDYASPLWEQLTSEIRSEIRMFLGVFSEAPERGLVEWMKEKATAMGIAYATLRKKYYALRESGGKWTVLIDTRKIKVTPAAIEGTAQPAFIAHVIRLVEKNQRKNKPAFRRLRLDWNARNIIPGYEGWPGWPNIPAGWSNSNLAELVRKHERKEVLRSIRVGTSSKTNVYLPTVLMTRVGMHHGAVKQLDDVWHDGFITVGLKRKTVRVLELGCLDVKACHRYHWGAMPRTRKLDDSGYENLKMRDMRFFLGGELHTNGYSPYGSCYMAEHGTAAITEDVERILYDATKGMIRVMRQPIETNAALNDYWAGSEGGNFHAKGCLESIHNLMHNDLAHLALQTGKNAKERPVITDRQLAYIARIIKKVEENCPERLNLLRLPGLDFHTQFLPLLHDYYHFGLATRTDHEIEGWLDSGNVVTEYTALPGSGQFMGEETFLAMPELSQALLRQAAEAAPDKWSQRRKLSPAEVWAQRPKQLTVPPSVLCDILTDDMAREVTARNNYLSFADKTIAPDGLIYEAQFISGPQRGQRIGHGEKVLMFANPYDDKTAWAKDAQGRYLGELPLYKRILPIDITAFETDAPFEQRPEMRSGDLIEAAGKKHHAIAEILQGARHRHAETVQDARDMREHNKRISDPRIPVTGDEIAEAAQERKTVAFGKAVAREEFEAPEACDYVEAEEWCDAPDDGSNRAPFYKTTTPNEAESW